MQTKPLGTPDPPEQLSSVRARSNNVIIQWNVPKDNGDKIQGFHVEVGKSDFAEIVATYTTTESRYTVPNLRPATVYDFRVAAFNSVGKSAFGNSCKIKTPLQ